MNICHSAAYLQKQLLEKRRIERELEDNKVRKDVGSKRSMGVLHYTQVVKNPEIGLVISFTLFL